ncbi:MAG: hypothetical protein JJE30_15535 [Desulfuromonadales bacterium]|nr:hypothetical protein [Desulfuromonadales bacterium]
MPLSSGKNLTNWISDFLKSPFLFAFLSGLYPVAFKSSKNWFLLQDAPPSQIVALFAIPPLIALSTAVCLYGSAILLKAVLGKAGLKFRFLNDTEGIKTTLCMIAATACMILFLDVAIKNVVMLITGEVLRYRNIFLIICVVAVPLLVIYARRAGTRYLNIIFIALVMFATTELIFNLEMKSSAAQNTTGLPPAGVENVSIPASNKPNVYLILLDAYTNNAALKKIFRTDNSTFRNELQNKGFRFYDDAYSNYAGTLPSMQSAFSMQHHYYKQAAGVFDSLVARGIISATTYNPVLEIFKRNGYTTRYIHDTNYECPKHGKALDYFTCYRSDPLLYLLFEEFNALRVTIKAHLASGDKTVNTFKSQTQRLKDIDVAIQSGGPFFMYIHTFNPGHAPALPYNKLNFFEQEYPLRIKSANAAAIAMLDLIIAKDPGAFIIVMGDHGPYRYGNLWMKTKGGENRNGIAASDLSMDLFGILMAIRYPDIYDKRFDNTVITPVNLFRYVFAVLSGNDTVLSGKEKNESYVPVPNSPLYIAAVDGKPLQKWVVFNNNTSADVKRSASQGR